jgi:opacity protein-like surface antigen
MKFALLAAVFASLFATSALAADCTQMADEKKLAGAARTSFVKKCEKDHAPKASAACEKSAADKKLAGAAKTSHLKKCMADEAAAKKP